MDKAGKSESEALRLDKAYANTNASVTVPLCGIPGDITSGLYTSDLFMRKNRRGLWEHL